MPPLPPTLARQDNIQAFWSWEEPGCMPDWDRAVNIDMIMNMEIMLWAAANGGNSDYVDAVERWEKWGYSVSAFKIVHGLATTPTI